MRVPGLEELTCLEGQAGLEHIYHHRFMGVCVLKAHYAHSPLYYTNTHIIPNCTQDA